MVHFSRSEDYAVIFVNTLTASYKKRFIPLSKIAKTNSLSLLFLRNIASRLRAAGIVKAIEGKNGGYALAKNPKMIALGKVIEASCGRSLFSCCQQTKDGKCHSTLCPHGFSLRRLQNKFLENIYNLTLSEVANHA